MYGIILLLALCIAVVTLGWAFVAVVYCMTKAWEAALTVGLVVEDMRSEAARWLLRLARRSRQAALARR